MEKQKANTLTVLEKQFRGLFKKASATKGVTGEFFTIM
jgi:small subunit ribosomal protein S4